MCIETVIQPTSNSSLHDLCNGHKDTALPAFVIECVRKEVPRVDWNCTVANTKNTHKKYASRPRSFSKVNVRNPVGWGETTQSAGRRELGCKSPRSSLSHSATPTPPLLTIYLCFSGRLEFSPGFAANDRQSSLRHGFRT